MCSKATAFVSRLESKAGVVTPFRNQEQCQTERGRSSITGDVLAHVIRALCSGSRSSVAASSSTQGWQQSEQVKVEQAPKFHIDRNLPKEHLAPAPEVEHLAPAPVVKHLTPAPGMEHLDPAPEVEHIASAPLMEHLALAPEVVHLAPAPEVEHLAPAPEVEHIAPAPVAKHIAPASEVERLAQEPEVEHLAPAPAVEHLAPAPVEKHIAPAPEVGHIAQAAMQAWSRVAGVEEGARDRGALSTTSYWREPSSRVRPHWRRGFRGRQIHARPHRRRMWPTPSSSSTHIKTCEVLQDEDFYKRWVDEINMHVVKYEDGGRVWLHPGVGRQRTSVTSRDSAMLVGASGSVVFSLGNTLSFEVSCACTPVYTHCLIRSPSRRRWYLFKVAVVGVDLSNKSKCGLEEDDEPTSLGTTLATLKA